MPTEREGTAYHEAGHAVLHHHLNISFLHVTIVPKTDESLGHVYLGYHQFMVNIGRRGFLRETRRYVLGSMAGPLAEEEFTGSYNADGAGSDNATWHRIIGELYGWDRWEYHEARLKRETRRLVQQHWGDIERIACLLLERETLTYEEVAQTLGTE